MTVVEWGEGLAEELAASFLQVTISRPRRADPAARLTRMTRLTRMNRTTSLRTVSVVGWGDRWATAAAAVHLALSSQPEVR